MEQQRQAAQAEAAAAHARRTAVQREAGERLALAQSARDAVTAARATDARLRRLEQEHRQRRQQAFANAYRAFEPQWPKPEPEPEPVEEWNTLHPDVLARRWDKLG